MRIVVYDAMWRDENQARISWEFFVPNYRISRHFDTCLTMLRRLNLVPFYSVLQPKGVGRAELLVYGSSYMKIVKS